MAKGFVELWGARRTFRRLKLYWAAQGIYSDPVSSNAISLFEAERNVQLPSEFREYLQIVNGTSPSSDKELSEFYSLDYLKLWSESAWDTPPEAPASFRQGDFIIFADYLQSCYAFAIRVSGEAALLGEVVHAGMATYSSICLSFREFIELYLSDDQRLHRVQCSLT